MMPFIIIALLAYVTWLFVRQFQGVRALRWQRRAFMLTPVLRHVRKDAQAMWDLVSAPFRRRPR